MKILQGPIEIGNIFGHFGVMVPEGKFAIVEECELSNGGRGWATIDGKMYGSEKRANEALAERGTK